MIDFLSVVLFFAYDCDADNPDSLNEDRKDLEITKLKKEIFEQERLLTGYQQVGAVRTQYFCS